MVWGSVQRHTRVTDDETGSIVHLHRQEMVPSKGMPSFPRLPAISSSSHDNSEVTGSCYHHHSPCEEVPPGIKIDLRSLNRTSLPIMSMARFSSPRFVSRCKPKACAKMATDTNSLMNRPRLYQSTNERFHGAKSGGEEDYIGNRANGSNVTYASQSHYEKSVSNVFRNNGQHQSHCHSRGVVKRDDCRVVGGHGVDHPVFVVSPGRKRKAAKTNSSRRGTVTRASRNYTSTSRRVYSESKSLVSPCEGTTPLSTSSVFEYPSTTPGRGMKRTSDNAHVLSHSKDKHINHAITNTIGISIGQQNNADPISSNSLITRLNYDSIDGYYGTVNGELRSVHEDTNYSTITSVIGLRTMSDISAFDHVELSKGNTAEGQRTGSISANGLTEGGMQDIHSEDKRRLAFGFEANESSNAIHTNLDNKRKSTSRELVFSESNSQNENTGEDNHLSNDITREKKGEITTQGRRQSMPDGEWTEHGTSLCESGDDVTSIDDAENKDAVLSGKSSRPTVSGPNADITFVETDSDRELLKPIMPTIIPRRPKFSDVRDVYLAACHLLKVTPASRFLRQLHSGVKNMDLSNHLLSDIDIKGIMAALTKLGKVDTLKLEGNDLSNGGVSYVAQFLVNDTSLRQLDLTGVSISHDGCRDLADALSYNSTLRVLKLGGNELSETHAVHIANFLKVNKGLKELHLDHNCLNEQGGVVLATALARNTTLLKLDLTWNHLRRAGATAICDALRVNRTLEVLNVSWNGFSREGCRSLGRVLSENDTLRELDISANRINAKAVLLLLKGLAKNESITTLRLGRNPMTTNGAISLIECINKSEDSRISHLDLSEVPVDEIFLELMKRLSQERSMTVKHGPCYRQDDAREGEVTVTDGLMRFDPLLVLFEYMKQDAMRVVDLFQLLDSDGKGKLTKAKLKEGIKTANLPLTEYAIEELLLKLDHDGDGRVELQDMMTSYRKINRYVVQRNTLAKSRGLREDKSLAELRDIVKKLIDERNERLLEGPDQGCAPKISILGQDRSKRKSTGDASNTDER